MADVFAGCCMSDEDKIARNRSKTIDKKLKQEKLLYRRTVKILLLGSGESGKSTFLKQMRIIHGKEYNKEELKQFKPIIYGNIIKGMKVLIDARDKLYIPWGDERNAEYGNVVFSFDNKTRLDEPVFLQYVPLVQKLWADNGIRTAFDRRREYQLVCIFYYMMLLLVTRK